MSTEAEALAEATARISARQAERREKALAVVHELVGPKLDQAFRSVFGAKLVAVEAPGFSFGPVDQMRAEMPIRRGLPPPRPISTVYRGRGR